MVKLNFVYFTLFILVANQGLFKEEEQIPSRNGFGQLELAIGCAFETFYVPAQMQSGNLRFLQMRYLGTPQNAINIIQNVIMLDFTVFGALNYLIQGKVT